jgi:hypothetical protein
MRLMLATDPGTPGWPNEDFAAVGPGAAVLLDGATTVPAPRIPDACTASPGDKSQDDATVGYWHCG